MGFPFDTNEYPFPGLDDFLDTVENVFWWGRSEQLTFAPAAISGAARDAGNTVTTVLRGGLLLGKVTASGLLKEWNPTGTDGSEVIFGVLPAPLNVLDAGANKDRYAYVLVGGNLQSDRLLVPGATAEGVVGDALEYAILNQLIDRGFRLDRHLVYGNPMTGTRFRYLTAAEIAADAVTVTAADHGRTFLMTGADGNTTFTPPAAKVGLVYHFWNNVATHNMVVTPASGSVKLPDADGTAATFTLNTGESATLVGTAAGVYQMINQSEATTD